MLDSSNVTKDLFATALNLSEPWYVEEIEFKSSVGIEDNRGCVKREAAADKHRAAGDVKDVPHHVMDGLSNGMELHIYINFRRGAEFPYPVLNEGDEPVLCKALDTVDMEWRHLNYFQYRCYIHARVPKVGRKGELSPRQVPVPWARGNTKFTRLFESFVVEMARHMPVLDVAQTVGENDTKLWRVIHHYVSEARDRADYSGVTKLGMDETSKKGHNYITVFVNLDSRRVVFVTGGKDHTTIDKFAEDFVAHHGDCDRIAVVTCDMSLGFKAGINAHFGNAVTIIDKFHVMKNINEAVDDVRKEESKENVELKGTKYIWLKNNDNLTEKQLAKKLMLSKKHLKTGRACMMREEMQEIYGTAKTREEAETALKKLCGWMMRSRIDRMKKCAVMLKDHWDEILNYFENRYTNAILEGLNNIIQNIKTRARGFKNDKYFQDIIYLVCGEIDIDSVLTWA